MRKKVLLAVAVFLLTPLFPSVSAAAQAGCANEVAAYGEWREERTAMPGERVTCRAVFSVTGGCEYVARGSFSPGVEFLALTALRQNGEAVNASAYTALKGDKSRGYGLEIHFASNFARPGPAALEIEYTVTLTDDASRENTAALVLTGNEGTYSASGAVVRCFGLRIYRALAIPESEKQSNPLPGTCYSLYRDRELQQRVAFSRREDGAYMACTGENCGHTRHAYLLRTGEKGLVAMEGLSQGTYYLLESRTPQGYSSMAEGTEIAVSGTGEITAGGVPLPDGRLALIEQPAGWSREAEEPDPLAFYMVGSRVLSVLLAAMVAGKRYLFR